MLVRTSPFCQPNHQPNPLFHLTSSPSTFSVTLLLERASMILFRFYSGSGKMGRCEDDGRKLSTVFYLLFCLWTATCKNQGSVSGSGSARICVKMYVWIRIRVWFSGSASPRSPCSIWVYGPAARSSDTGYSCTHNHQPII